MPNNNLSLYEKYKFITIKSTDQETNTTFLEKAIQQGNENMGGIFKIKTHRNTNINLDDYAIRLSDTTIEEEGIIRFNYSNNRFEIFKNGSFLPITTDSNIQSVEDGSSKFKRFLFNDNFYNNSKIVNNDSLKADIGNFIKNINIKQNNNENRSFIEYDSTLFYSNPSIIYNLTNEFNLFNHSILFKQNDEESYKVYVRKNHILKSDNDITKNLTSTCFKYDEWYNHKDITNFMITDSFYEYTFSDYFPFYKNKFKKMYINNSGFISFSSGRKNVQINSIISYNLDNFYKGTIELNSNAINKILNIKGNIFKSNVEKGTSGTNATIDFNLLQSTIIGIKNVNNSLDTNVYTNNINISTINVSSGTNIGIGGGSGCKVNFDIINNKIFKVYIYNGGINYEINDKIKIEGTETTICVKNVTNNGIITELSNVDSNSDASQLINQQIEVGTTTSGNGSGCTINYTIDKATNLISNILINNPGINYSIDDELTIENSDATFKVSTVVEGGVSPLPQSNGLPAGVKDFNTGTTQFTNSRIPVFAINGTGTGCLLDYTVINNKILNITIINGGTNYVVYDKLTIKNTNTTFIVSQVDGNGTITDIANINNSNDSTIYTNTKNLSCLNGSGTQATVDLFVTNNNINEVVVNNSGINYQVNDILTISNTNTTFTVARISNTGQILGILNVNNTNDSNIYTNNSNAINCINGSGSSCKVNYLVNNNKISQIFINEGGTGYNINDVVTIDGTNTTFTVYNISSGFIDKNTIKINNPGIGFFKGDILNIDGTNALIEVKNVRNDIQDVNYKEYLQDYRINFFNGNVKFNYLSKCYIGDGKYNEVVITFLDLFYQNLNKTINIQIRLWLDTNNLGIKSRDLYFSDDIYNFGDIEISYDVANIIMYKDNSGTVNAEIESNIGFNPNNIFVGLSNYIDYNPSNFIPLDFNSLVEKSLNYNKNSGVPDLKAFLIFTIGDINDNIPAKLNSNFLPIGILANVYYSEISSWNSSYSIKDDNENKFYVKVKDLGRIDDNSETEKWSIYLKRIGLFISSETDTKLVTNAVDTIQATPSMSSSKSYIPCIGGSGSGCLVSYITSPALTSFTIVDGGSGYSQNDTLIVINTSNSFTITGVADKLNRYYSSGILKDNSYSNNITYEMANFKDDIFEGKLKDGLFASFLEDNFIDSLNNLKAMGINSTVNDTITDYITIYENKNIDALYDSYIYKVQFKIAKVPISKIYDEGLVNTENTNNNKKFRTTTRFDLEEHLIMKIIYKLRSDDIPFNNSFNNSLDLNSIGQDGNANFTSNPYNIINNISIYYKINLYTSNKYDIELINDDTTKISLGLELELFDINESSLEYSDSEDGTFPKIDYTNNIQPVQTFFYLKISGIYYHNFRIKITKV